MSSKRFVYGFLVILGTCMIGSLYFFLKNTNSTPVNIERLHVDWESVSPSENIRFNGEMQFEMRCSSCHGPKGKGGLVGPSLSDSEWRYGRSYDQVFRVICNGVPGTEMKGWGDKLFKEDLVALTVYVKSLESVSPTKN